MATNRTFATVISRAQGNLNDEAGTFWTSGRLLPHAADAYQWAYNEMAKYSEVPFEKVVSLTYTANTDDQSAIMPADFYTPVRLDFRLNTSEEWVEVERKDELPSRETEVLDRVIEWEFRNRVIFTNKSSRAGLLRLRYLGLLSDPSATSDPVLMDNLVSCLGFATAGIAYGRRGQEKQAALARGMADTYMSQITDILVKNLQYVQRRGRAFSGGRIGIPANRGV